MTISIYDLNTIQLLLFLMKAWHLQKQSDQWGLINPTWMLMGDQSIKLPSGTWKELKKQSSRYKFWTISSILLCDNLSQAESSLTTKFYIGNYTQWPQQWPRLALKQAVKTARPTNLRELHVKSWTKDCLQ